MENAISMIKIARDITPQIIDILVDFMVVAMSL